MQTFSSLIIPAILTFFGIGCLFSKKDLPGAFTEGAKEGLRSCIGLLPTLVLLMTAVAMFRASGAAEALANLLRPVAEKLGIPPEITTLLLVRPFSGSGATALLSELYETFGPDSFPAKCASVLTASSDTLVYVLSVCLTAAGVKKSRHTLPAAILTMLTGIFLSCLAVRLLGS